MAAGLVVTKTVRIVEADIYARRKVGCEPDEPRVAPVVGRPRLARDRLADGLDHLGRAPLHHALQHRHNLEGRPGIGYLLTRVRDDRHRLMLPIGLAAITARALVGAKNRGAVAVLHSIDKGRS